MTYQCTESCEYDAYDLLEQRLMQMTFLAHKAVLFEKIKARIEQEEGQKLEKIAELLVTTSQDRWKTEQEATKKEDELREKLKNLFDA